VQVHEVVVLGQKETAFACRAQQVFGVRGHRHAEILGALRCMPSLA
jgi:3-mercaptopyruvate sulfurtransferase SseA